MNQADVLKVMETISGVYDNFKVTEQKFDAWNLAMQEYDFDRTMWNLKNYIKTNRFPPTVSDLIQDQVNARRSESNQTVDQVMANVNKSWEQRKKELDDQFAKQGIKIEWNEPDFSKSELPDFLKNRHKKG